MPAKHHGLLIAVNDYPNVRDATLKGCINDLALIGRVLIERFRFAKKNLKILRNEEATQAAISAAFDEMVDRVGEDDIFVCFYAGHGSRIEHPGRRGEMIESIVPYDSGRGELPNRDIFDVEIDRWIRRLNAKTPYVTLIFDCCHSGSVTRDVNVFSRGFVEATRSIPADRRPPETMFEDGQLPTLLAAPRARSLGVSTAGAQIAAAPMEGDGEVPSDPSGPRRSVTIAACRADELANEYRTLEGGTAYRHGALSFFLGRALNQAGAGATWRDVFDRIGPVVSAKYSRQHPQITGKWDEVLFGTEEIRPASHLKVVEVTRDLVELSGGAAHGVTPGSLWSVHDHGTRHAGGEALALLEVESVAAASSTTRVVKADTTRVAKADVELEPGQRAFVRERRWPAPGLSVRLATSEQVEEAERLRSLIAASQLVVEAGADEPADALIRCLKPSAWARGGDLPGPRLETARELAWTAVGTDGRLMAHLQPVDAPERLVADLENVARFQDLLALENLDSESALRDRVQMTVQRWHRDNQAFVEAQPTFGDGVVTFDEGKRMDVEIRNGHDAPVWVSLVEFGSNGKISLRLPVRGHPDFNNGGHPLAPEETLSLDAYYSRHPMFESWDGLRLSLPDGFPWAAEPGESPDTGYFHLKLMVTPEPADFEFLEQGATRDPGPQAHPLLQLTRLYASGQGRRSATAAVSPNMDWTTLTRTIGIRRRPRG